MDHPKTTPKDFFLHLLAVVTLYACASAFVTVLFQLVNLSIPDPLSNYDYEFVAAKSLLRNALSFVIVMFPSYLVVAYFLNKDASKNPEKRHLRIARWLMFFTIFGTAVILLGTLVSLVNYLLNGELTWRFGLKVLSIFVVAGGIHGYQLTLVKKQ